MVEPSSGQDLLALFPRVSTVGVLVGITTEVVSSLLIGALTDMIIGTEVTFGAATGPKTTFGGAISGEKILPLRVILLVPTILLMSESSSLELISSAANPSYLIPW